MESRQNLESPVSAKVQKDFLLEHHYWCWQGMKGQWDDPLPTDVSKDVDIHEASSSFRLTWPHGPWEPGINKGQHIPPFWSSTNTQNISFSYPVCMFPCCCRLKLNPLKRIGTNTSDIHSHMGNRGHIVASSNCAQLQSNKLVAYIFLDHTKGLSVSVLR